MKQSKLLPAMMLVALAIVGCTSNKDAGTFEDPEVISKDESFRKSISEGSFVKLSQGYTYYEFANRDADTVLVMVHGFSVPSYIWDSTFIAAKARGYAAVRYDVYGRGYSDNPDVIYDAALYSGQLKELLDALNLSQKVNLMGLSYGGRIISAFAYQFPERVNNLIFVDPSGFEDVPADSLYPAQVSEKEIDDFKRSDTYRSMAKGQLQDFYDTIPFTGWDKQYEAVMRYKGFVRALISTRKNSRSMEQEHRRIASLGLPVFAIWGDHDTVVPLESVKTNLYDRIPNVELYVLPKSGHLPHMEQTAMFNSIIFDQILCCQHPAK